MRSPQLVTEAPPAPKKESLPANRASLDNSLAALERRKTEWARLPISQKIEFLHRAIAGTARVAERQATAAARAKGLTPRSAAAAEDLIGGPYLQIRTMRLLAETLEKFERTGRWTYPRGKVRTRSNGRLAAEVFPQTTLDRVLYQGFRAEVWMDESVNAGTLAENRGVFYRQDRPEGKVALVLGAGNVASIAPLDAVQKLFAEGQVVLLKLNPVNDYLGPILEEAFSDLIEAGFLDTAYGGADVGAYLCEHPSVDEIHITGSAATHDAIVFGTGSEGADAKRAGRPQLDKQITSELGNVSPIIIFPGEWSNSELDFHAENLATQMTQNGGFNCNATKMILTHADWPQREALLDRLESTLTKLPTRPAYYPGARSRYESFVAVYPEAKSCGPDDDPNTVPPTLIRGLAHDTDRDLVHRVESFCAITAETPLPADTPESFLERAVNFCNERLYGTLNAGLIVAPRERSRYRQAIDRATEELRYGSVVLNHWPALAYGLGTTTWGAYPGHTLQDIQSGIGVVHNALLFDHPEKSVVEGPFRVVPKPAWFVTHKNAYAVAERLVELEADPTLLRVPRVLLNALFG